MKSNFVRFECKSKSLLSNELKKLIFEKKKILRFIRCSQKQNVGSYKLATSLNKMNIPKTTDDFQKEFYLSIDLMDKIGDLRIRQFIDRLDNVMDEIIVNAIIKIFESADRPSTQYTDQKYAGIILNKLKPKTEIDINIVLKSTIENWNKSVEEFPFWLKENYGLESLKKTLTEFDIQKLNDIQTEKIKTYEIYPNSIFNNNTFSISPNA